MNNTAILQKQISRIWNIRVTRPAPSFAQDTVVFEAATYAEAVAVAQAAFRQARRSVTLSSGKYGIHGWHRIDRRGIAQDYNTNSGIPEVAQL